MSQSLFTSQTPTLTDIDNGSAIETATTVTFSNNGTVSAVRFYAPGTVAGATFTVGFYQVTTGDDPGPGAGTLLGTGSTASANAGTWNTVSFTPVTVTAGVPYRTVVHNSAGRYVATSGGWASSLTNGYITGLADNTAIGGVGTIDNGTFEVTGSLAFPNDTFGSNNYFVDVVYDITSYTAGLTTETDSVPGSITRAYSVGLTSETDSVPGGLNLRRPFVTPPTIREGMDTRDPLYKFFSWDVGITLLVSGVTVTETRYPWQGDLDNYDYVYMGGRKTEITNAEVTILTNAGYGSNITYE